MRQTVWRLARTWTWPTLSRQKHTLSRCLSIQPAHAHAHALSETPSFFCCPSVAGVVARVAASWSCGCCRCHCYCCHSSSCCCSCCMSRSRPPCIVAHFAQSAWPSPARSRLPRLPRSRRRPLHPRRPRHHYHHHAHSHHPAAATVKPPQTPGPHCASRRPRRSQWAQPATWKKSRRRGGWSRRSAIPQSLI